MQQFVVPQFIDVEDKVIGPVTVRQFIIILVGAGLVFIAYKLSDFTLFLVQFIVISALTLTIAFIKINGRPIHYFLLNFLQTIKLSKLRIWINEVSKSEIKDKNKRQEVKLPPRILTKNKVRATRLAEISLIVDTGGVYQGEEDQPSGFQNLT